MAENYWFFNSAPGDPRFYEASHFSEYFNSLLSSGLLIEGESLPGLKVSVEASTLNTKVAPGKAVIEGRLYENTSEVTLAHPIPEQTIDRIDRVVLRLDLRNSSRSIRLFVKEGVSAENPVPPALQRDNSIYELSLAQVRLRANTSTIDPADVVDERMDADVAGLAYSLFSTTAGQLVASNVSTTDVVSVFNGESVEDALFEIASRGALANVYRSDKNELGAWRTIEERREDGSLFRKSVLSNPDTNGNLQTQTITVYLPDGTSVVSTEVWNIEYDSFGDVVNEVKV